MQSNTSRARAKYRETDPQSAHLRYKEQADTEGEVDAEGESLRERVIGTGTVLGRGG